MFRKRKSIAAIVVMFCITALTAFTSIALADGKTGGGEHCGKHYHHNYSAKPPALPGRIVKAMLQYLT